eukprot:m51a1_g9387 putative tyrosine-protein kinase frk (470) ;mRNA; f:232036-234558
MVTGLVGLWGGTTNVAMKTVKEWEDAAGADNAYANEVMTEAALLSSLRHPNITQLYGVVQVDATMYLVMELADGCLLVLVRAGEITLPQALLAARDVAAGMNYLAVNNVVHRDLACRNVLYQYIGGSLVAKVTDFGLSRIRSGGQHSYMWVHDDVRPLRWMPPEAIFEDIWSDKSDVWAMGVLMWEMMSRGARPWDNVENKDLGQLLVRGDRLAQPPECPERLYALMSRCWVMPRTSRPSFRDIFSELTALTTLFPIKEPDMQQQQESYDVRPVLDMPLMPNETNKEVMTYHINSRDVIVYVEQPFWDRSLREHFPKRVLPTFVGTSLWDHISGVVVQHVYKGVIARVRKTQSKFLLRFRGDVPGTRRLVDLLIFPLGTGGTIAFRCSPSEGPKQMRPLSQKFLGARPGMVLSCSFCKRVQAQGDEWSESMDPTNLTYRQTCCPECFDSITEKLRDPNALSWCIKTAAH